MTKSKFNVFDAAARAQKSLRTDGWNNIYSGRGIAGKDKDLGTSYGKSTLLNEQLLRDLYRGDGLAKRIINLPTGEMVREWFTVGGDSDGDVVKYLHELKTKKYVLRALRWARLFGGSIMVMGIDDGGDLEEPLNENNIRGIEFFRVYDRWRATWTTADMYDDPAEPKYGTPERFQISPVVSGGSTPFKIHETRLLRFDGVDCDDRTRQENNGWGDSYLQSLWTAISELSGAYKATKEVIDDFIQIILKIQNLQDMIAAGQEDVVKRRLEILDLGRHVMNTLMLDSEEDYSKEASRVAGLDKLLQEFQKRVSSETGIPMTLLMGQSPGGLNSTGEGDIQLWYDNVAEDQEDELLPHLQRLVYLSMLAKEGPTKGKVLEDWTIDFTPLWQPTEAQLVETRHKQAGTDKIYIDTGVLLPGEVANSRFGGDDYSIETDIEEGMHEILAPEDEIPEPEPERPPAEPNEDEWEKIKLEGESEWVNHHKHPYVVDEDGNGELEKGTFHFFKGSEETYTITHTHAVIAFNVSSGGLDNHYHRLEYDRNE